MSNTREEYQMNKLNNFEVDHTRLKKGLYVCGIDHIGSEVITTFDLRMKMPNREKLGVDGIHTIEHLMSTFLRSDEEFKDKIIYFGPMACLTGMSFIVHGAYTSEEIKPLIKRAFEFVAAFRGDIPGAKVETCGNYELHSLTDARQEAQDYLNVLKTATIEQMNYPAN